MKLYTDYPLRDITTMHLDARCRFLAEYDNVEELLQIMALPEYRHGPTMQIGGGSNLVFTADYYDGMLLHSGIQFIRLVDQSGTEVRIEVGAGVVWDTFVKYCIAHGYHGAENLSGIPGEVGASAVQNIGSYGVEVCRIIERVNCIDKETGRAASFTAQQCQYGYRDSIFKRQYRDRYIVTSVIYRLSLVPAFTLTYGPLKALAEKPALSMANVRSTIIAVRNSKLPDPAVTGSVGSFFKNPVIPTSQFAELQAAYPTIPSYPAGEGLTKVPAGWLIENAGLKGCRRGGAVVYEKQCLVIANEGNATGADVVQLYQHVIATVKQKFGIELHPEANII